MGTHLDEVLVETVIATVPSALSIHKSSGNNVDIRTNKTRPGFRRRWKRTQEVTFGFLCQRTICLITSQIRQVGPLQHQSAHSGESVCLGAVIAAVTEQEVVGGNARRSVESVAQVVGEVDGLL
jgi:hypothetical protein